jgi:hypothetical protein
MIAKKDKNIYFLLKSRFFIMDIVLLLSGRSAAVMIFWEKICGQDPIGKSKIFP